jgi:hypothetical protein
MDDNARLKLQSMIKTNNVEDQTSLIRDLKHSEVLRKNVNSLIELKKKYNNDIENDDFKTECMSDCVFLFMYYTDIYNKIRKDEIELKILFQFLDVLKEIEEGTLDQHEGSFKVGTLLKELYIDSALKKADKLEKEHSTPDVNEIVREEPLNVTWKQFKRMKL